MRTRGEILGDAVRYTDSKTLVPEHTDKLRLLTLEALVDLRDLLKDFLDKGSTWDNRFIKTP